MGSLQIQDIYPLSHMQKGMLFDCLYEADSDAYFEQVCCRIRGRVDVPALQRAWEAVVRRHDVLRSSFDWEELDQPVQIVFEAAPLELTRRDFRDLEQTAQVGALDKFLREDRKRGFDLAGSSLMRLALIQLQDEEFEFVWSHHHILLDGWSVATVANQAFSEYQLAGSGLRAGTGPYYRDYIAWLQSQDPARSERYWRERLAGYVRPARQEVLNTPAASDGGDRFAECVLSLGQAEGTELRDFARRHRLTLSTVFHAAWAVVVASQSLSRDVAFGVTTSGRPPEVGDVEAMVGLFMNTLPLRVPLRDSEPVTAWLELVQARLREIEEHGFVSLADVQRWSALGAGERPFESLVVFENYPLGAAMQHLATARGESSLVVDDVRSFERTSFPLSVLIRPGTELSTTFVYDTRRYSKTRMERLAGHFLKALRTLQCAEKVGQLSVLTEAERYKLVVDWNDTRTAERGHERPLHEGIADQVARAPDRIAVTCEGQHLTYRALNERAGWLAETLRARGVRPGDVVGVHVERSVELPVALLGVLKAGAAYLPIDPSHPAEYLKFLLEDSGTRHVVTVVPLENTLASTGVTVTRLDRDCISATENRLCDLACSGAGEQHLAYVIYTSGSSGRPKGVMIPHSGIWNRLRWMQRAYPLSASDRILQKTPFHFDVSVWELFWPLLQGACMVLAKPAGHLDNEYLSGLVAQEQITALHFVPSMLLRFLESGAKLGPSVVNVFSSGEVLESDLERRFFSVCGGNLHNLYGPTEASVDVTAWRCRREGSGARVPLGRPIDNTQIYVVDAVLDPVPIDTPGELCIAGDGLAWGYINNAALTAQKFLPNPLGEVGSRLYRTGDKARVLDDGTLEYIGRFDHQVKVQGVRIELGELEGTLSEHPLVQKAIAAVHGDASKSQWLVAYVVCEERAGDVDGEQLRRWMLKRLPRAMVPSAVVRVDAFPLLPNGKVDRAALPSVSRVAADVERRANDGAGQVAHMLAGIYSAVLGVDHTGTRDSFFALGGHSILAMQLASRVQQVFSIEVSVRDVFETPVVEDLAGVILARMAGGATTRPASEERPRSDRYMPVSFAQERLWFLNQLDPDGATYNIVSALRLEGPLDRRILEQSVCEIARRHEVLRSRFQVREGQVVRSLEPAVLTAPIPVVDLSGLSPEERESAVRKFASDEAAKPFLLSEGPLFRATLLKLGEYEHVGILVVHHIAFDGWSIGIFHAELAQLYRAFSEDRPAPLDELPIRYSDVASQQRSRLEPARLERLTKYWKAKLFSLPTTSLPTDFPRASRWSSSGGSHTFRISPATTRRLNLAYRAQGLTPFMSLLAAFKLLIWHLTKSDKVVVGTDVANRHDVDSEKLIGCFLNQLALCTEVPRKESFREFAQLVRATTVEAIAHQDLPFEKVVEAVNPTREWGVSPLFQAKVVLRNMPRVDLRLPGLTLSPVEVHSGTSEFELLLVFDETEDGGMDAVLTYREDLFRSGTVRRMVAMYEACIAAISKDPETPLRRLDELMSSLGRPRTLEARPARVL